MFRMLSAILLASPAGMGGGVLCLLGLIWCFSPAPLPLALATLLAGGGLLFLVGYALRRDRVLVQRGDSVTGHAVKVTRSIAKFSLTLSTPGPEIHPLYRGRHNLYRAQPPALGAARSAEGPAHPGLF